MPRDTMFLTTEANQPFEGDLGTSAFKKPRAVEAAEICLSELRLELAAKRKELREFIADLGSRSNPMPVVPPPEMRALQDEIGSIELKIGPARAAVAVERAKWRPTIVGLLRSERAVAAEKLRQMAGLAEEVRAVLLAHEQFGVANGLDLGRADYLPDPDLLRSVAAQL